jgi:hypothetical protein
MAGGLLGLGPQLVAYLTSFFHYLAIAGGIGVGYHIFMNHERGENLWTRSTMNWAIGAAIGVGATAIIAALGG